MKLLVDAQLPRWLAKQLAATGHDAIHVVALSGGSRTPDEIITAVAVKEARIVVTKDADFVASF